MKVSYYYVADGFPFKINSFSREGSLYKGDHPNEVLANIDRFNRLIKYYSIKIENTDKFGRKPLRKKVKLLERKLKDYKIKNAEYFI